MRIALMFMCAVALTSVNAQAQVSPTATYPLLCSWAGGQVGQGLYPPKPAALYSLQLVSNALSVGSIPIYEGNVPNAAATVLNGAPAIVYNTQFFAWMYSQGGDWATTSIIAHELGHHLNFDSTWYGQFLHPWTRELRADYVSGFAMARLGASLEQATSALRAQFSYLGTPSHPDSPKRIDALAAGWHRGLLE